MVPGYLYKVFSGFAVVTAFLLTPARSVAQAAYPLPYTITTVAGGAASGVCSAKLDAYGDGCPALQATFGTTQIGMAVDATGNLYVADAVNKLVRKVDAKTGLVSVVAFGGVACANAADRYGDGCVASTGTVAPGSVSEVSVARNGDIYMTGGFSLILKISATTGIMSRVAGVLSPTTPFAYVSGFTGDGGPATSAELNVPRGVTVNAAGDIYIADYTNNVVRVIYEGGAQTAALITATNPSVTAPVVGYIYTIAGSSAGSPGSTDGVLATSGLMLDPADVQIDSYGNVYILDSGNKTVRVVYSGGNIMGLTSPVVGYIYKVAGGGSTKASTLTTTKGTSVGFSVTRRMAMDAYGNLYVTDSSPEVVWFLDATTGYMRPIAGTYTATAGSTAAAPGCPAQTDVQGDGCPALKATIHVGTGNTAYGLAVDANNNLYIAETYDLSIRKVSTGLAFPATSSASPVTQTVQIHFPKGTAEAVTAPFVLANTDYTAGTPACVTNTDTTQDCTIAITLTPTTPGVDDAVLTSTNTVGSVSKFGVTGAGVVAALALDPGTAASVGSGMNTPQSVTYDSNGNLLIADTANNRVLRIVAATQVQTVVAGTGVAGNSGDGSAATGAKLNAPKAVAAAPDGTIYVADTGNNVIRRIDAVSGNISTYAGGATTVCAGASDAMGDGCAGTQTIFSAPAGIVVDTFGSLYVADSGNNVVRVVPQNQGAVTVVAGGASTVCGTASDAYGDTCAATQAVLLGPTQLRLDVAGNLYIADTKNNLVRRVNLMTKGQSIATVAGNGQVGGSGDGGAATSAQLSAPAGIALDGAGDIYIADTGNHVVRMVSAATGNIATIAGINGSTGVGALPGAATSVLLKSPAGVEVTGASSLYVLDTGNNRALAINRNTLALNLGKVNITSTSANQPVTLTSAGSAAVSLGTPLVTASGSSGEFTFTPATTNGCSAAQSLAAGAQCVMSAVYAPTVVNAHSATYTFAGSTGVNSPTPAVTLSGTGVLLVNTSSVAVQTTPAAGNPQYGQTTVVTVTVTPVSQGASTISGSVTVQIDGTAQQPVSVVANGAGNGVATITLPKLSVGPHTIVATYSGDDVYGGSNAAPLTVTVSKATASATVSAAPTATIQFQSVTFTANVSAVTGGIPTGTVSFMNGATVLGTGGLNAQGVATFTTTSLAVASYNVVAAYGGDGNFTTANSTALPFVVSPDPQDFTITPAGVTTLNVAAGGTVQTTVTVTPTNTMTGNVTFSCSGLPANSVCTFLPSVITFTPATDQPVVVTVGLWTGIGPGTVPTPSSTLPGGSLVWIVLMAPLGVLALSRKRVANWARVLGAVCLLIVAAGAVSGCATGLPPAKAVTPAGTSTVTVQATGPNGQSHALPLVFNVISQ